MHQSGPFSLVFKSPEQDFWGKNCQNASQGKPYCLSKYLGYSNNPTLLSTSFCKALLILRRSKFAYCCHHSLQNLFFYSIQWVFKLFIFPMTVKMPANYAQINRVGSLDASFQQVPLVQNFKTFHNIV